MSDAHEVPISSAEVPITSAAARLWDEHRTLLSKMDTKRLERFCAETDRKVSPAIRYAVRRMLDEWEAQ